MGNDGNGKDLRVIISIDWEGHHTSHRSATAIPACESGRCPKEDVADKAG
jgi:hypothetical protein